MAKAIDVAKYILTQREARTHMTTTFALQKMLYYCQSWMLVAYDTPLFPEEIQAWEHGPVVPEVYPYCKGRHYIFQSEIPEGDSDALRFEERALVDTVISMFENEHDHQLGDMLERMSHDEKPWADVKNQRNQVISKESMLAYYAGLQADEQVPHSAPIPNLTNVSSRTFIDGEDAAFLTELLTH